MKILTIVIFISLPEEIPSVEKLLKKFSGDKVILVCSTPEAQMELTKRKINFIDSSKYYPKDLQIISWKKRVLEMGKNWYKIHDLAQEIECKNINLGRVTELGFHIYLSEVVQSILTAQNLLDTTLPDIVFCNPRWPESPFRRYQTETLNLESLSLWLLAKHKKIKVFNPGPTPTAENRLILFLKTIAGSIFSSIKNVNSEFPDLPVVILGNHYQLENLEPTLTEFIKEEISFLVTGKTSAEHQRKLKEKKVPFLPFSSGSSVRSIIKYLFIWQRYKTLLIDYFSSFNPLLWNFIEPKLWWYFINELPSLSSIAINGQKLFGNNTKIFITMASADHFSRTLALIAKSKGVKVVELQHGLYLTDIEYPFRDNDYFLIWSESQRNQLYDGKNNPTKYPIAGYPWFDQYRNITITKNNDLKTKIVLVLANFPRDLDDDRLGVSESPFQFMKKVFIAVSSIEMPTKVIFRPHPSCQAKWVIPLAKHYGITFEYDNRSLPLPQAISNCDLVITNFTTAIVDVMFIGRPILLHTFHSSLKKQVENFDATKLGAWKLFHSGNGLLGLINQYLNNKEAIKSMLVDQKKFIKEQVTASPVPASRQIVNLIQNYL